MPSSSSPIRCALFSGRCPSRPPGLVSSVPAAPASERGTTALAAAAVPIRPAPSRLETSANQWCTSPATSTWWVKPLRFMSATTVRTTLTLCARDVETGLATIPYAPMRPCPGFWATE
ncbi:hypothetical protein APS67_005793 [Streptomyces sp. AVP053U2]|nr:hypothetical protein APS67_005793 [Streptomyces sp. AVP053U2]